MKTILFDLDNTLYPAERDLFSLIDVRINRYMEDVVAIPTAKVDELRRHYWGEYGATLQGLIRHYGVDAEDYLDYVHAVDVDSRLQPDLELRTAIAALPLPCHVFTNGSHGHAERVISALGLNGLFEEIFDIRIADYQPKPCPDPYHRVLDRLQLPAELCIFIEDSLPNLQTAKQLGMTTVLVGDTVPADFVDHHSRDARGAAEVIGLWLDSM